MRWLAIFFIFVGAFIFANYFWAAARHGLMPTAENGLLKKNLHSNPRDYWWTIFVSSVGCIYLLCAGLWLASTQ